MHKQHRFYFIIAVVALPHPILVLPQAMPTSDFLDSLAYNLLFITYVEHLSSHKQSQITVDKLQLYTFLNGGTFGAKFTLLQCNRAMTK